MSSISISWLLPATLCWALGCTHATCGAEQLAEGHDTAVGAEIFPASTIAYFEIPEPAKLVDVFLTHPFKKHVEQLDDFKKAIGNRQAREFKAGLAMLELRVGREWPDLLKSIASHGLYLGIDGESDGVALLFRADNEALLKRVAGTILDFVKDDAEKKNRPQPFKLRPYRDFKVADFGEGLLARWKTWFVISNKRQFAEQIADGLIDGQPDSLSDSGWFQEAENLLSPGGIRAFVNLNEIRNRGLAKDLFKGRTDDPNVELIFGGLLDALHSSEFAVASADFGRDFEFTATVPFTAEQATESRRFFFGDRIDGRAPKPLLPENLSLTLHKDKKSPMQN